MAGIALSLSASLSPTLAAPLVATLLAKPADCADARLRAALHAAARPRDRAGDAGGGAGGLDRRGATPRRWTAASPARSSIVAATEERWVSVSRWRCNSAFAALLTVGRALDVQVGGLAMLVDPTTRGQMPLIGTVFAYAAAMLFFAGTGPATLLAIWAAAFDRVPLGTLATLDPAPILHAGLWAVPRRRGARRDAGDGAVPDRSRHRLHVAYAAADERPAARLPGENAARARAAARGGGAGRRAVPDAAAPRAGGDAADRAGGCGLMAEGRENRSEEATPFKLRQARQKGMVARGLDLGFAASLVGLAAFVSIAGIALVEHAGARDAPRARRGRGGRDRSAGGDRAGGGARRAGAAPRRAVRRHDRRRRAAGGDRAAARAELQRLPFEPHFTRLNPAAGLKRLFSRRMLMEAASSGAKLALYATLAVVTIRGLVADAGADQRRCRHPRRVVARRRPAPSFVFILLAAAIAVLDQIVSRRAFARQMRMSRREVTREIKDREGDTRRLKRRRQQLHTGLVEQAKGLTRVRDADLLLVNPEHVAVALGYRPGTDRAPRVLAKGEGYHALRLRRAAGRWNVPIVRDRALARALFAAVDQRQEIATTQFEAVAEHYLKLGIVPRDRPPADREPRPVAGGGDLRHPGDPVRADPARVARSRHHRQFRAGADDPPAHLLCSAGSPSSPPSPRCC
ncbi:EscU/YscU/HrcU family type III secretion system export apparatus switch protein [Sphingomonas sp. MMS24-JH45]